MNIATMRKLRQELYDKAQNCVDLNERSFLWLKIEILNAHIKGELPV